MLAINCPAGTSTVTSRVKQLKLELTTRTCLSQNTIFDSSTSGSHKNNLLFVSINDSNAKRAILAKAAASKGVRVLECVQNGPALSVVNLEAVVRLPVGENLQHLLLLLHQQHVLADQRLQKWHGSHGHGWLLQYDFVWSWCGHWLIRWIGCGCSLRVGHFRFDYLPFNQ